MKKVNIICKIIIALMLLFCLSYTILFLCAKYGSKIDIENSIYPKQLKKIKNPPQFIYANGNIELLKTNRNINNRFKNMHKIWRKICKKIC